MFSYVIHVQTRLNKLYSALGSCYLIVEPLTLISQEIIIFFNINKLSKWKLSKFNPPPPLPKLSQKQKNSGLQYYYFH